MYNMIHRSINLYLYRFFIHKLKKYCKQINKVKHQVITNIFVTFHGNKNGFAIAIFWYELITFLF